MTISNRELYEHLLRVLRSALVEHATLTPGYIPHKIEISVAGPVWQALYEGSRESPSYVVFTDFGPPRRLHCDRIVIVHQDDEIDIARHTASIRGGVDYVGLRKKKP